MKKNRWLAMVMAGILAANSLSGITGTVIDAAAEETVDSLASSEEQSEQTTQPATETSEHENDEDRSEGQESEEDQNTYQSETTPEPTPETQTVEQSEQQSETDFKEDPEPTPETQTVEQSEQQSETDFRETPEPSWDAIEEDTEEESEDGTVLAASEETVYETGNPATGTSKKSIEANYKSANGAYFVLGLTPTDTSAWSEENNRYEYLTGQSSELAISVNNDRGGTMRDTVVRVYFYFDDDQGTDRQYPAAGSYQITNTNTSGSGHVYDVEVVDATPEGIGYGKIYYYDISHIEDGDTLNFFNAYSYPNLVCDGGNLRAWVVPLATADAEKYAGQVINPEETINLNWTTKTYDFEFSKSINSYPSITVDGSSDPMKISISNISYYLYVRHSNNAAVSQGNDNTLWVDLTDTLQLPDGIDWAEEVLEAIENENYVVKSGTLYAVLEDSTQKPVFYASPSNEISAQVVEGENGKKLIQANWRSYNSYRTKNAVGEEYATLDYPAQNCYINFYGAAMTVTPDEFQQNEDGDAIADFWNKATEQQTFSFSEEHPRKEAETSAYRVTIPSGIVYSKWASSNTSVLGTPQTWQIRVQNVGMFPNNQVHYISDVLNSLWYMSAEDIEKMFADPDYGDGLTINIKNATLYKYSMKEEHTDITGSSTVTTFADNTGYDVPYSGLATTDVDAQGDPNRLTTTAAFELTKADGAIQLTYKQDDAVVGSYTVGDGYKTLQDIFDALNFYVTAQTAYSVEWHFEEGLNVKGGTSTDVPMYSHWKNSFMLLTQDAYRTSTGYSSGYRYNYAYFYDEEHAALKDKNGRASVSGSVYGMSYLIYLDKTGGGTYNSTAQRYQIPEDGILSYTLNVYNNEQLFDTLPVTDHLQDQFLLIPVNETNTAALGETAESLTIVTKNETDYYQMDQAGEWKGLDTGSGRIADTVTVTGSGKYLSTLMRWYYKDYAAKNSVETITYLACVNPDVADLNSGISGDFTLRNESWLGDHQTRRFYDTISYTYGTGFAWRNGSTGDDYGKFIYKGGSTSKHSTIESGSEVTYRIKIGNEMKLRQALTGDKICDMLPNNRRAFTWSKENVTDIRYEFHWLDSDHPDGEAGSCTTTEDTYWYIDPYGLNKSNYPYGTGYQYIRWKDDFALTMEPRSFVYIFITLKFPKDEEGVDEDGNTKDHYQEYLIANKGQTLENRFYLNTIYSNATHELAGTSEAILRKGVSDVYYYVSGKRFLETRDYYANSPGAYNSSVYAGVDYYITLYNSGNTRLYVPEIDDVLPRGFHYYTYSSGYYYSTLSGVSGTHRSVNLSITVDTDSEGREHLRMRPNGSMNYDSTAGMYYLVPGEYISVAIWVRIDKESNTEDIATNAAAVPFKDYYNLGININDQDSRQVESIITGYGSDMRSQLGANVFNTIEKNDGDYDILQTGLYEEDKAKLAQYGFDAYSQVDTDVWLTSEVSIERADGIIPGINKSVAGVSALSGTYPGARYGSAYSGAVLSGEVVNWKVNLYNDKREDAEFSTAMFDYTIEDSVDLEYAFTGDVQYALYKTGTTSTSYGFYSLFQIQKRSIGDGTEENPILVHPGYGYYGGSRYLYLYEYDAGTQTTSGSYLAYGGSSNSVAQLVHGKDYALTTGAITGEESLGNLFAVIRFERNEDEGTKGKEKLVIQMKNFNSLIPAGYNLEIKYSTQFNSNNTPTNDQYINNAVLRPTQTYDSGFVANGQNIIDDETGENVGVQKASAVTLILGYATSSVKSVSTLSSTGAVQDTAYSDRDVNFVTLKDKDQVFRYDLSVYTPSERSIPFYKLVICDSLPQVGDTSAFSQVDARGSEYKISINAENPDFKAYCIDNKGKGTSTDILPYVKIYVSTNASLFDEAGTAVTSDWEGKDTTEDAARWTLYSDTMSAEEKTALLANARSIRFVVEDPEMEGTIMTPLSQVKISFNAIVDDPATLPNQKAWNSFGYRCTMPLVQGSKTQLISLSAAPLGVGVEIPCVPTLTKRLQNETGTVSYQAKTDLEFRYLVYEGNALTQLNGNAKTEEEIAQLLTEQERAFTVIPVEVKKGATYGRNTALSALKVFKWDDETGKITETEAPWNWTNGSRYTVVELPPESAVYEPISIASSGTTSTTGQSTFTQTYNASVNIVGYDKCTLWTIRGVKYVDVEKDADGNRLEDPDSQSTETPDDGEDSEGTQEDNGDRLAGIAIGLYTQDTSLAYDEEQFAALKEEGTISQDAAYELTYNNKTYLLMDVQVTDENGEVEWVDLREGEYCLSELSKYDNILFHDPNLFYLNRKGAAEEDADGNALDQPVYTYNIINPQRTEYEVQKSWDDCENEDWSRPDSILVQLCANGEPIYDKVELSEENNWTYRWTQLRMLDEKMVRILYTVVEEEEDVPKEYTATAKDDAENALTVITNTHDPHRTEYSVEKIWDDCENEDWSRPESILVQLYADGEPIYDKVELTEENQWKYTWTQLRLLNAQKEKIVYNVVEEEADVPEGYTATVKDDAKKALTTITNFHEPERVTCTVKKVWDDNDNEDWSRPESIQVQLMANDKPLGEKVTLSEENKWTYTWTELTKYDGDQKEIIYSASELAEDVPEGYTVAAEQSDEEFLTVLTNSHTPKRTEYSVKKIWEDEEDKDGSRPDHILVQLYQNGKPYLEKVELNDANDWSYTWEDLRILDESFVPITYRVVEEEADIPAGYEATYQEDAENALTTITNTHTPESETETETQKQTETETNSKGPKTGDDSPLLQWTLLLLAGAGVSGFLLIHRRRRIRN